MKKIELKGYIFDLDGVIVDTAKYHYNSWRRLANELGFDITVEQNENLKGVSRRESLEYILKLGDVVLSEDEIIKWMEVKNEWYVDSISHMDESELLSGAKELIIEIKTQGLGLALGSASKNSERILRATGLYDYFDTIIDGNKTTKSKPDPQVFDLGAVDLGLHPSECVVFEDSIKGVQAANTGGFISIGIGDPTLLHQAHRVLPSLSGMTINSLHLILNEN